MRYMLGVEELEDKRRSEQKKQEERAAALLGETVVLTLPGPAD